MGEELFRCQALGQGGASDPDCLRAWAENRRRFLAPGARPEARLPAISMFPAAQDGPDPGRDAARGEPAVNGTGVVDNFLNVFTTYIDSGFGLLHGEVAFIATTLIVIDVTLAALFWSWGEGDDIIARLVKKTLFVGVFAYIIGNWNTLAKIVFESFAGLGAEGRPARAWPKPISCALAASPRWAWTPASRSCLVDLRPDGLCVVLRELHPDRRSPVRLDRGGPGLLHHRHPALHQPDRVQADHPLRLRPHPVRPLRQDRFFMAERVLGNVVSSESRCWFSR